MRQRPLAIFPLALLGVMLGLAFAQVEPGPPPRVVGEPVRDNHLWAGGWMYEVHVYLGGEFKDGEYTGEAVGPFAAGGDDQLKLLLRTLGTYYASEKRLIRVQIWDYTRQEWHDPLGRKRPAEWDGLSNLQTVVKAGSADL